MSTKWEGMPPSSPEMLMTLRWREVGQMCGDGVTSYDLDKREALMDSIPSREGVGKGAKCGQLVEVHQSKRQMMMHLLLRRIHGCRDHKH